MTTLYMLCGLPGSGKTVRAEQLEAAGEGVILNADSWVCQLYPEEAEAAARDERKFLVHRLQWYVAEQLLTGGVSVILDWGLWSRAERDHYRQRARELGATVGTVFLDEPIETLHERVAHRNRNLPAGTFSISAEELDQWSADLRTADSRRASRELTRRTRRATPTQKPLLRWTTHGPAPSASTTAF